DGSFGTKNFQIGANANETISLTMKDVSSAAIGRTYQSFDTATTGAVVAATASAGTKAAPGELAINIGGTESKIALQADMGYQDLQDKINNISGVSGVVVTQAEAVEAKAAVDAVAAAAAAPASMTISGIALDGANAISMTFNGNAYDIAGDLDSTGLAARFAEIGAIEDFTVDSTTTSGSYILAGLADGSNDIAVGIDSKVANTNASGMTITTAAGPVTYVGDDSDTTADVAPITASGTVAVEEVEAADAVVAVPNDFTIDFSNAKLDTGIEAVSITSTTGGVSATTDMAIVADSTTFDSVAGINLSTQDGAQDAISIIDAAIASIDSQRADLGAVQNRMNFT
ncbi:hypothetical protein H5125_21665, partial [Shewanella sp. SR44-4]|nr:hypothetical protein [Shewanella sp. SR44-4]